MGIIQIGNSSRVDVQSGILSIDSVIGSGYSAAVLADSPVGYWRLNEAGGTGGPGTLKTEVNSPTLDGDLTSGLSGATGALSDSSTAYEYTGFATASRVSGVDDDALLDITGSFTIECFVQLPSATSQSNIGLVSKWGGSNAVRSYLLDITSPADRLAFGFQESPGSGTFRFVTSDAVPAFNDDAWHHVVGVFDKTAGTLDMYIDTVVQAGGLSGLSASVVHTSGADLEFGSFSLFPTSVFTGFLDEVAIYSTALTPGQIATHFAAI